MMEGMESFASMLPCMMYGMFALFGLLFIMMPIFFVIRIMKQNPKVREVSYDAHERFVRDQTKSAVQNRIPTQRRLYTLTPWNQKIDQGRIVGCEWGNDVVTYAVKPSVFSRSILVFAEPGQILTDPGAPSQVIYGYGGSRRSGYFYLVKNPDAEDHQESIVRLSKALRTRFEEMRLIDSEKMVSWGSEATVLGEERAQEHEERRDEMEPEVVDDGL